MAKKTGHNRRRVQTWLGLAGMAKYGQTWRHMARRNKTAKHGWAWSNVAGIGSARLRLDDSG
eukprot:8456733-Lingulodinium_polyedra.AAC.1